MAGAKARRGQERGTRPSPWRKTRTLAKQKREWRHPTSFCSRKIYDLSFPLYSPGIPGFLLSLINGNCSPARLHLFHCINKADAGDNQAVTPLLGEAHPRGAVVQGKGAPATQEEQLH